MNIEEPNQDRAAQPLNREVDISQPDITDHQDAPRPTGARRFLLPGILGLLLLGGIGWLVFSRVIMPMMMFSNLKPQPTEVKLGNPQSASIADSSDYAATLDSRQSVVLQPRVSGQITQIAVQAGDRVTAGTLLLQIDAGQQQAQVNSREAAVDTAAADIESARADVTNARDTLQSLAARRASALADVQLNQQEYTRYQNLYSQGATSRQTLDQRLNALRIAQANLNQAEADIRAQQSAIARTQSTVVRSQRALQQTQANVSEGQAQLQYYSITAPFTGIVGDIPVKEGDFVDTTTRLATLTQNQELEIQIQVPLERAAGLRRGLRVQLLDNQNKVLQTGRISFAAPNVDPRTQSVLAKAVFQNVGNQLRTAQFVRARVIWKETPGLLVPTSAISRLAGKNFVFVAFPVKESGCEEVVYPNSPPLEVSKVSPDLLVAVQQEVNLGQIVGNNQEVKQDAQAGSSKNRLRASDRLVVSGILNLKQCTPITPEPAATP